MKKKFNTTGTCFPKLHYMMNNTNKFVEVMELIELGEYFSMHHPRQFGKTTMIETLVNALQKREEYLPIRLNFQGIDSKWHESDEAFGQMFIKELIRYFKITRSPLATFLKENPAPNDLNDVSDLISDLVIEAQSKVVVLIDEVDASSNYAAFVNFLTMLRNKYLIRGNAPTFYSVVLVGVHDIKNLKFKLRNPEEAQYNSPWNIAVDFKVDLSFNPKEIAPMLEQYTEAEGVQMDIPAIAERLHYHTSGYPFLISKICKDLVEDILPYKKDKTTWTLDDVEASVRLLLKQNNTNFDSLFGNLENHKDLYDLTARIILDGAEIGFNQYNPTIYKGILYGIFKRNGKIRIHNRIYEQLIYSYLSSKVETATNADGYNVSTQFLLEDGSLDFKLVLLRFQQFLKEEYSDRDQKFLERQWRLLFLAFIRPIVNGEGYTFKEVQVSQERRLDVVVTYLQYRYIVELKRWYGGQYHDKGLDQLHDYLELHGLDSGYLLIFDERKQQTWSSKMIIHKGKSIFTVWV